jgi:hypothetical protein
MTKYKYWFLAIGFALVLNFGLQAVQWNEMRVIKQEMDSPKRVEFTSLGVVHSWPVDNYKTKIVSAE